MSLGTTQDSFRLAMEEARAGLTRLQALAQAAPIETATGWTKIVHEIGARLEVYDQQASFASTNVNLSMIDALASGVNQIIARDILQREMRWRKQLGLGPVSYSPRGRSGVVSVTARPDLWYRGYLAGGQGMGDPGFFDTLTEFFYGRGAEGQNLLQAEAGTVWNSFKRTARRVAAAKKLHAVHAAEIARMIETGEPAAASMQSGLRSRVAQTTNAEDILRSVAGNVDTMGGFKGAREYIQTTLADLTDRESTAIIFYAQDVAKAGNVMDAVEEGDREYARTATGFIERYTPAAAGGAGLLAAGALAYILLKKR